MMQQVNPTFRTTLAAAVAGLCLLAAGCATKPDPADEAAVQAYNEANDPYEPMNRYFFEVNNFLDEILLKPFAGWYHLAMPDPAEDGVRNFLRNLKSPVYLANDLFQGEWSRAGTTVARFFINSTIGVGGLIDVASMMDLKYHEEDFGQTLAVWGTGEGPYLHLPLIGPSNPRDTTGRLVDYALDPLTWVGYAYNVSYINTARAGLDAIDTRARNLEAIDELKKGSVDFYATVRSLYRQKRNDLIKNGETEQQASQIITEEMIPEDGDMPVVFAPAKPEDQVTTAE
ncbi:MAG TPA: VacJ family lipoprotein [Alphaproteobacteria bacterium]|nr:VacJ family lipoprotein [Alphaproteobacteria bacterium]